MHGKTEGNGSKKRDRQNTRGWWAGRGWEEAQ